LRTAAEFNAADRGPASPAGESLWSARRLIQPAARARERGSAPQAVEVLRELLGDADRAAAPERLESAAGDRLARCRELLRVLRGRPMPAHREEFAWVVAALRARAGG
jgi:hypothetical protein